MNQYGLIGYPLDHSFSKKYYTEKFENEGLKDCTFDLFPLKNIKQLNDLLADNPDLIGLAVTIPYKGSVIPFLSSSDIVSREVGAVNCIKVTADGLKGYNTDITGFAYSFLPLLKKHHTHALVLGSGGSSMAVQYVLKTHNIPFLIVSRSKTDSDGFISYDQINAQIIQQYPVIINCTPAGMFPSADSYPLIPYELLTSRNLLFDLVYNPAETVFLYKGKNQGAAIKNGLEMLVIQAEENWKIWNAQD